MNHTSETRLLPLNDVVLLLRHPRPWFMGQDGIRDRDGALIDSDLALGLAINRMNVLENQIVPDAHLGTATPAWFEPVLNALYHTDGLDATTLLVALIRDRVLRLSMPHEAQSLPGGFILIYPIRDGWQINIRRSLGDVPGITISTSAIDQIGPALRAALDGLRYG